MNWKWKALLQFGLSVLPQGERANYLLQRYVTKSLPISDLGFADHVHYARKHIEAISRNCPGALKKATFYEFGAGWDIIIPLGFYGLGVERQIVTDVRNLLRPEIVNDTIERYAKGYPVSTWSECPGPLSKGRENRVLSS